MNKYLIKTLSVLIPVLFSCEIYAQDFTLIGAVSQKWYAGVRGGGGGVNYTLMLVAGQSSSRMKFEKIWVDGRCFAVGAFKLNDKRVNGNKNSGWEKKDTIMLKAFRMDPGERLTPENEHKIAAAPDTTRVEAPVKITGEALVTYFVGKKKKYFQLEKFTVLKALAYP